MGYIILIIQDQLKVAPNAQVLERFLGKTRIILLQDCTDEDLDTAILRVIQQLNYEEQLALSALSAFRWGFNHAMASLVLNNRALAALRSYSSTWDNMRDFLSGLREKGVLRYGQGWYHLPFSLRNKLQRELPGMVRAEYHAAAGEALAPYTMNDAGPSLAFDRAFFPENVYEAFFHFDRAGWLAHNEGLRGRALWDVVYTRKIQLLRFTAFPTWSAIGSLTSSYLSPAHRDAYAMGKRIVETSEKTKLYPIHPAYYLNVIKSAIRCINGDNRPHIKEALDKELTGPEGFFEKALKACEDPQFEDTQRNSNRLAVWSTYANYLTVRPFLRRFSRNGAQPCIER